MDGEIQGNILRQMNQNLHLWLVCVLTLSKMFESEFEFSNFRLLPVRAVRC